MRFPKVIRNKKSKVEVTIYGKKPGYPFYRVCWRAGRQRRMKSLASYSAARKFADETLGSIAKGSQATALTSRQAADALAALERLAGYYRDTGRKLSLNAAVNYYCEAATRLRDIALADAITGFLGTVAAVKRVSVADAVKEFLASRETKTKAAEGQRAQLSGVYHYMTGHFLGHFSAELPGTDLCDLTREHIDLFMAGPKRARLSPKSRNHYKTTLAMFVRWAQKKDYLPPNSRLLQAEGLVREALTPGETDFYGPEELRKLLAAADANMRPLIAIQGLAGLRQSEALRLTWQDVFGTPGHITVTASKSKTRSRRLVEIVPALTRWLESRRQHEGLLWTLGVDMWQENFKALRENEKIPARKNGLRHAFCTYHFALHANENLTAQQAGNSPTMIHQHYKGLATKAEAEKWFSVAPEQAANIIQLAEHKNTQ